MTEPTPASVAVVGIGDQPEQASGAAMPQAVAARKAALATIAAEVRECRRCPLWVGRTKAVAGEGDPDTDVVLVGEGPGINEDRQGRPFVGRAGDLLVRWLATLGWRREEVFITNVVKCRPPDNRDPEPAEIAACAPFLTRQLEVLDPSLIVTLGRHSMGRFMPGARIGGVHGTMAPVHEPALRDSMVYALYHPAAALRSSEVERQSFADVAGIPAALTEARRRRAEARSGGPAPAATNLRIEPAEPPGAEDAAPPTLF
jgi:uracil-DNA glycosylase